MAASNNKVLTYNKLMEKNFIMKAATAFMNAGTNVHITNMYKNLAP